MQLAGALSLWVNSMTLVAGVQLSIGISKILVGVLSVVRRCCLPSLVATPKVAPVSKMPLSIPERLEC